MEAQGFPFSPEIEQAATALNGKPYRALLVPQPMFAGRMLSKPKSETQNMNISRRTLLQGFLGIAGTTLFSERASQISTDMLPFFAALTDTCRQLSQGNELSIAEQILWTYLPKIELLARLFLF